MYPSDTNFSFANGPSGFGPSLLSYLPPRTHLPVLVGAQMQPPTRFDLQPFIPGPPINADSYFHLPHQPPSQFHPQPYSMNSGQGQGQAYGQAYGQGQGQGQAYGQRQGEQYRQGQAYGQGQRQAYGQEQRQAYGQGQVVPSNQYGHHPNGDVLSNPSRLHPPGGRSQMSSIFGDGSAQSAPGGQRQNPYPPQTYPPRPNPSEFWMRPNGAGQIISEAKRDASAPAAPYSDMGRRNYEPWVNPHQKQPQQQQQQQQQPPNAPLDSQFHTKRLAPPGGKSSVFLG